MFRLNFDLGKVKCNIYMSFIGNGNIAKLNVREEDNFFKLAHSFAN